MPKVELIKLEHLDEIMEISQEQFLSNGWQMNLFVEELEKPDHFGLVLKENNEIVSFVFFMITYGEIGKEFNILNLATKENFKHKGFAFKLLDCTKKIANRSGVKSLWLEVREGNLPAKKLYEKFGFKTDYIRKKYYSNGENANIMSCKL